jgi:hypothetical protein
MLLGWNNVLENNLIKSNVVSCLGSKCKTSTKISYEYEVGRINWIWMRAAWFRW